MLLQLWRRHEFNLAALQQFQTFWKIGAPVTAKKLEQVRCFFRFCMDREFIPNNPAEKMHAPGLRRGRRGRCTVWR